MRQHRHSMSSYHYDAYENIFLLLDYLTQLLR